MRLQRIPQDVERGVDQIPDDALHVLLTGVVGDDLLAHAGEAIGVDEVFERCDPTADRAFAETRFVGRACEAAMPGSGFEGGGHDSRRWAVVSSHGIVRGHVRACGS
jgi:hypothetical protein